MRIPPGRTGRLWLHRRLAVARRGAEVLEQKTRALLDEERRLGYLTERTRKDWEAACRDAQVWYLRAMLLGGERQVPMVQAATKELATVDVRWRSTMGATYPFQVSCSLPPPVAVAELGRSAALPFAAEAYRRALEAGTQHAAAKRAQQVVTAELAATRRRLRGVRYGWIPRLEDTLHALELRLAEREREDMVRGKWVSDRSDRTG